MLGQDYRMARRAVAHASNDNIISLAFSSFCGWWWSMSTSHRTSPVWRCRFSVRHSRISFWLFINILVLKGRFIKGSFRMRTLRFTSLVRFTYLLFFKNCLVFWRIVDPSFLAGSGFGSANKIKRGLASYSRFATHLKKGFECLPSYSFKRRELGCCWLARRWGRCHLIIWIGRIKRLSEITCLGIRMVRSGRDLRPALPNRGIR